jgi:hypothetical protein
MVYHLWFIIFLVCSDMNIAVCSGMNIAVCSGIGPALANCPQYGAGRHIPSGGREGGGCTGIVESTAEGTHQHQCQGSHLRTISDIIYTNAIVLA